MGKIYKVVLNSDIAGGNLNSQQRFFYDWNKLEQGEYKCSFTYIGGIRGNTNANNPPVISIDLGQSNVYFAKGTNTLGTPSIPNFLGALTFNVIYYNALDNINNNGYLYASLESNPPIYLQQRPTNNIFSVFIQQITTGNNFFNSDLIGIYTLTLYLEKLD